MTGLDRVSYCIFRPTPQPQAGVPMGVRSVGHYRAHAGWRDATGIKPFAQLYWGITGEGALVINGAEQILHAGQVAVYYPGMCHHVYATTGTWDYRWFTMDGHYATGLLVAFGLQAGIVDAGPAPCDDFERLVATVRDVSREGELMAGSAAYAILSRAAHLSQTTRKDELILTALRVMHARWQDPNFGVDTMANELACHRSRLSRRFSAAVGCPPVKYLRHLRIQRAMSLLRQTAQPIADIAQSCGFRDPKYFARVVRQTCGVPPRVFRSGTAE